MATRNNMSKPIPPFPTCEPCRKVKLEDNVLLQLCNVGKSCLLMEGSASDRRGEGSSRLQPLHQGALGIFQTVARK